MNICSYCMFLLKCLIPSSMQASRLHANPSSWLNSFHRGDAFSGSDFCVAALQQAFKASTDSLLMMNQHFWKGGVLAERDSWMPFLNPSHGESRKNWRLLFKKSLLCIQSCVYILLLLVFTWTLKSLDECVVMEECVKPMIDIYSIWQTDLSRANYVLSHFIQLSS